jgi:dihydroorotate dehydrogenase (NAD+) catalytic subunit
MVSNKSPQLAVELNGLKLKNPVIAASGTFGYGLEYKELMDLNRLGGIVVKGISLWEEKGNAAPRIYETPAGMLNAIGLQNVGVHNFLKEKLPQLKIFNTAIIVNIWGRTIDDYVKVAEQLSHAEYIDALEVNISCPNIKQGGMSFGQDEKMTYQLVKAVKKATQLPLIVKLTPNVTNPVPIAQSAEDAGAHSISLINTLLGMVIDIETKKPVLSNITGGLSGPAIRPVALRMVWQVASAVSIPVIGLGGIASAEDALQFLIAGAQAVQIGSANFRDPLTCLKVIEGIEAFLIKNNFQDINQLIGTIEIE